MRGYVESTVSFKYGAASFVLYESYQVVQVKKVRVVYPAPAFLPAKQGMREVASGFYRWLGCYRVDCGKTGDNGKE